MPNKDGTGPGGRGSMTGHGGGKCVIPINTKEEELEFLKRREQVLKKELETVENRIKSRGGLEYKT